jgi:hypothetical protein
MNKKIVPWVCDVCGREIEVFSGGVCRICNRSLCYLCLGIGIVKGFKINNKITNPICKYCTESEIKKVD